MFEAFFAYAMFWICLVDGAVHYLTNLQHTGTNPLCFQPV